MRWRDAYSSVWPPDKKVIPTKAGGTDLERALTVLTASSWMLFYFFLLCVDPYKIMLGFKRHPSNKTLFFCKALNVAVKTL